MVDLTMQVSGVDFRAGGKLLKCAQSGCAPLFITVGWRTPQELGRSMPCFASIGSASVFKRVANDGPFMARLEFIEFRPWSASLGAVGPLVWQPDQLRRSVNALPQIFWGDGSSWAEANLWALDKAASHRIKAGTILSLMRHLQAYAEFLEGLELDWRHFPTRRDERVLVRFRGDLIDKIKRGSLQSSTARSRMSAVIQFYRYSEAHGLVSPQAPMWAEKMIVIPWFDSIGFKRTMARVVTDLNIPNNARPGGRLEDGLLPLSNQAMMDLLKFIAQEQTTELYLMLNLGFFTGARLGTITTLRRENLNTARPDPLTPGVFFVRIGPGTGVATKFDVEGDLMIPEMLLDDLKVYAESVERLHRQAKARVEDKTALFLTRRGNRYGVNSVDRLIQEMRKRARRSGLNFVDRFKFHQTRATYGTWLMQLMLSISTVGASIEFVRRAMLHKHESTTFLYVKFLEQTRGKQQIAQAFNEMFTGLRQRDWDRHHA